MAEDNKPNLEREIKNLTDQIDIKRKNLDTLTKEFGELEQEIEILYHSIFQKNTEIQAIEDDEKDQFKDNAARLQFELDVKKEQLDQLIKTKLQKTSEKSRMLVQEFYLNKYKIHSEKLLSQQVKLEVQSVKIMYLKQDPSEYLEKQSRNSTTIQFVVQTFSINKKTLIKDLFDQAIDYFQISISKKEDHVLTDTYFNDLSLLYSSPAEAYFSSLKEQCMYAELYLKPKYQAQSVLLDKQQESIQLGDGVSNLQTTTDTERKNLLTIFSNFEKVFNGIQLYSTQAKNDYNMMLLQKVKNRFWLNMFHMALYITIISAIVSRLSLSLNSNVFDIKENSKYFLETFSDISQPVQDNQFFQKCLNGFSRSYKYLNTTIGSPPATQLSPIFSSIVSLGTVRIVLKKTKQKVCNQFDDYYQMTDDELSQYQCSESIITSSTEETKTINGLKWTSEEENGIDSVDGFFGTYSGGGYKIDFNPYILDLQTYMNTVNQMESYVDYQTKAAIIYGAFYDISNKYFMSVYYKVDLTSGGIFIEGQDVQYFQLYYPDQMDSKHKTGFNISIASIVLMSLIFVISIFVNIDRTYQTYKLDKEHKLGLSKRELYQKLFSFQLIAELGILIVVILSHIYIYSTPNMSFEQIIQTQHPDFINIHKYGYMQQVGNQLLALSIILLVLFLCINLPLNFELQNFQRMIQNSLGPLIVIVILIFTLICSIALILQRVFGPYMVEFTLYGSSFCETIFTYFFGDYVIQQQMWQKNLVLSLVLVAIVFLSIFYGSVALFNSVLFEKYRLVSTKLQFNEQQIDVAEELNEKLKNIKSFSCWKCFKKSDQKSQKKPNKK
ncbi:polycystin cation channel protein (macronuclear) [Tetrahymena thermophila SB210]|uniref:Polycystin cation channel protein n=1 Tax=Tetrahymena thermophila (strain SB210) TaxID=312017 RepID=Q22CG2_TETTS|nr:polycystin cation channel protein [Tetrahymena thermophila SB210]EAR82967.2 polycystin cation channel protein [Tetrahymena thermophila SB210]|eukprot:XP_001030630.2 polycystin cation channel protein [Tetrahymena thermophila SB210]